MWKTTDRYVQQKRVKAVEAESKLKQVYIPNYNKPPSSNSAVPSTATVIPLGNNNNNSNGKSPNILNGSSNGNVTGEVGSLLASGVGGSKACESCQGMQSGQWYAWGPSNMQCRLCQSCWTYWKKYGGLKVFTLITFYSRKFRRSKSTTYQRVFVEKHTTYVVYTPYKISLASISYWIQFFTSQAQ